VDDDRSAVAPRVTRARRRWRHHLALAGASTVGTAALWSLLPGDPRPRLSLALAYIALGLLATTLILGPLNILRRRPNPVSFDLRRDLGIWSAVTALAHTVVGLTVHFHGRMHFYFLAPPGRPSLMGLRIDGFGLTNHAGLAAALLLATLAGISSDWALGRLGARRWKAVQRAAYVAGGLTVAHGLVYQALEKRSAELVAVLVIVALVTLLIQWRGRGIRVAGDRAGSPE
jgi:sulfoxide reductase heme-binding subunit YedZ